jgi:WD40 repeat protein
MAVKPWLGAIKAPSDFVSPARDFDKAPEISIKLDYVHGYRAKDSRMNVYFNSEGHVVTHAAAVGFKTIVPPNESTSSEQTHNTDHTDDIMSIAQHPNKAIFATGEIGPKPKIFIWDSTNECKTTLKIHKNTTKGVDTLGFSPDGNWLACSTMDDNHSIYVFDANTGELSGHSKGSTKDTIGLMWDTDSTFITYGISHYKYWNFTPKNPPKGKECKAGSKWRDTIVSGVVHGDKCLHGASNGEFQVWSKGGFLAGMSGKLHGSCLDAITVVRNDYILTGAKDHKICLLDPKTYKKVCEFDTYKFFPKTFNGNVRALDYCESTNQLAVGLFSAEIYQLELTTGGVSTFSANSKPEALTKNIKSVINGHFSQSTTWTNEVWGLEIFNKNKDLY